MLKLYGGVFLEWENIQDRLDNRSVKNNKGRKQDLNKKRDKAWKKPDKRDRKKDEGFTEMDDDILYLMNQIRCQSCKNPYPMQLDKCPYCKT